MGSKFADKIKSVIRIWKFRAKYFIVLELELGDQISVKFIIWYENEKIIFFTANRLQFQTTQFNSYTIKASILIFLVFLSQSL